MTIKKNENVARVTSGIFSILPIVILGLGGFAAYSWIKNMGGVTGLISGLASGTNQGVTAAAASTDKGLVDAATVANSAGRQPTASDISKANQCFELINFYGGEKYFSHDVSDEIQSEVLAILKNVDYIENRAMIYLSYGKRTVDNRTSIWLGDIWDNTSGTLVDHVTRFFDGNNKTQCLAYLNGAIAAYLV